MKQFLLDKFNELNDETLKNFHTESSDFLPIFGSAADLTIDYNSIDPTVYWGRTADGFWTAVAKEIQFFDNAGAVHIVSGVRQREYFDLCQQFFTASGSYTDLQLSEPVEYSQEQLTSADHPYYDFCNGTVSYIKLQLPNNSYGIPLHIQLLSDPDFDVVAYLKQYIDITAQIFATAGQLGQVYPEWLRFNSLLTTDTGIVCSMLPNFTYTNTECLDHYLSSLEQILTGTALAVNSKDDILQYARTKWQPILAT